MNVTVCAFKRREAAILLSRGDPLASAVLVRPCGSGCYPLHFPSLGRNEKPREGNHCITNQAQERQALSLYSRLGEEAQHAPGQSPRGCGGRALHVEAQHGPELRRRATLPGLTHLCVNNGISSSTS